MFSFSSRKSLKGSDNLPSPEFSEQIEATIEKDTVDRHKCRVYYRGTTWPAQCIRKDITLNPEEVVYVIGRKDITLFFETDPNQLHLYRDASSRLPTPALLKQ